MNFEEMKLREELLKAVKHMGFVEPTPIQASCIPQVLAGKDVIGQSLTGSGKTAAFGLPILGKLLPGKGIQLLVLTPTRELCAQVRDHLDQMAKFLPLNIYAIYGGVGFFQQFEDIRNAEVIVATPGRLLDHIRRQTIHLKEVKFVVLDEADKMLEMGFEEDVEEIIKHTPKERQTVFFSATMPAAALRLINKYLKSPVIIKEKLQVDRTLLKQVFYDIGMENKFSLLVKLLKDNLGGSAIVFCGTKRNVDKVSQGLKKTGIRAMPVHGDLNQNRRLLAVRFLTEGKIDVLVATDVAARGLDIKDITHIYNYDVPRTPEEYIHRIGRTARAGKKGEAVTLLAERDYKNFEGILRERSLQITQEAIPPFEKVALQREHYGGREYRPYSSESDQGYRPHQRRDYNYGPAPGREESPGRQENYSYGRRPERRENYYSNERRSGGERNYSAGGRQTGGQGNYSPGNRSSPRQGNYSNNRAPYSGHSQSNKYSRNRNFRKNRNKSNWQ